MARTNECGAVLGGGGCTNVGVYVARFSCAQANFIASSIFAGWCKAMSVQRGSPRPATKSCTRNPSDRVAHVMQET
jgi:hypothetical protein